MVTVLVVRWANGLGGSIPLAVDAPGDLPAIDPATIVSAIITLTLAYLLARGISYVLTELSERAVDYRIGIRMSIPMFKFGIYLVAVYIIFDSVLNLTSAQLLAFSGLLGAALGFGLQDLFAGIVGGFVILLERPYRAGDKVNILDHYGEVVDIGLRATRIVTPDDDLVSIPNYVFFTEAVSNANAGDPEMMVVMEFYVSVDADLDRAVRLLEDAVVTSQYVYVSAGRPASVSVRDRPYYRLLRVRAYVNDHRHERAFVSDVTDRTLTAFEEAGIEKPRGVDVHGLEDA